MAITAMGLGTKAAPTGANLDPQTQFWSFLSAFCGKQVKTTTGSDNWTSRALFSGFRPRANDPADMSVLIGGENGTIDSAVLIVAGSPVLLSTDGDAQKVTIPTAPSAGARYDAIVSYIDKTSADPATEEPGTPDYIKTIVVSGTVASSPDKPTDSQIKAKLPAGVSNYFRWCNVYVESGATDINDSNIEDARPASPNVYYANPVQVKTVTVYGMSGGIQKTIEAPGVDGYRFACWINTAASGRVAWYYVENPNSATSKLWYVAGDQGACDVTAYAMYTKV